MISHNSNNSNRSITLFYRLYPDRHNHIIIANAATHFIHGDQNNVGCSCTNITDLMIIFCDVTHIIPEAQKCCRDVTKENIFKE